MNPHLKKREEFILSYRLILLVQVEGKSLVPIFSFLPDITPEPVASRHLDPQSCTITPDLSYDESSREIIGDVGDPRNIVTGPRQRKSTSR
jgi:hypothetical protein